MKDAYIADEAYQRLVEALAHVQPCPVTGGPNLDAIKIVLGDIGGIWPEEIAPAVQDAA